MDVDYLIEGAGASGMAFLDVILAETDATVAIVDRRDQPGGHWVDAYPFVRLHQSSSFYGVPSRPLGSDRTTDRGWNAGLFELATKNEILHYYQDLMEHDYVPTGRVHYFPLSEHVGGGVVRSLVSGQETRVTARKTVRAGFLGDRSSIPATHQRNFEVADGVACIPPNDLPRLAVAHERFVVLGAGKTAMDSVLWLLAHGVSAAHLTWVRPNDYWVFRRDSILPHPDFFETTVTTMLGEMKSLAKAKTVEAHCARMEEIGLWARLDPDHWPERFHAAVCSTKEIAAMRGVTDVVRKGRVKALHSDMIVLEQGEETLPEGALIVDCTASAAVILNDPALKVFDGNLIHITMLRPFQPVFSAALIAHIEATIEDEEVRQAATQVVDFFDTPAQSLTVQRQGYINQHVWNQTPVIKAWIDRCRLNAGSHLMRGLGPEDGDKMALVGQIGPLTGAAVENIPRMVAPAGSDG